jgi:hypothetical protein
LGLEGIVGERTTLKKVAHFARDFLAGLQVPGFRETVGKLIAEGIT